MMTLYTQIYNELGLLAVLDRNMEKVGNGYLVRDSNGTEVATINYIKAGLPWATYAGYNYGKQEELQERESKARDRRLNPGRPSHMEYLDFKAWDGGYKKGVHDACQRNLFDLKGVQDVIHLAKQNPEFSIADLIGLYMEKHKIEIGYCWIAYDPQFNNKQLSIFPCAINPHGRVILMRVTRYTD